MPDCCSAGWIVRSAVGRDRGQLLCVLGEEGEFLLLADGKERKAERPKRKKQRHVRFVSAGAGSLCEKIRSEERVTNSELRKALAVFRGEQDPSQEG